MKNLTLDGARRQTIQLVVEEVVDTPFIIKRLESCGRHPRFSAEGIRAGGRKVRTRGIEKPEGVIFLLPSEQVSSLPMQMGFPYYTDHRTPFFSWPPLRWLFEEAEVTKSLEFLGPETKVSIDQFNSQLKSSILMKEREGRERTHQLFEEILNCSGPIKILNQRGT